MATERTISHVDLGGMGQVIINLSDGSNVFVTIGSKSVDTAFQPDDNHYPVAISYGTIPTGPFDPY